MSVIIIIILAHLVSFAWIIGLKRRYRPQPYHEQSAFSVLLGIYLLFFLFTAVQAIDQMTLV